MDCGKSSRKCSSGMTDIFFGDTEVYNPWSVLDYVKGGGIVTTGFSPRHNRLTFF